MPKLPRPAEEIKEIRQKILDQALEMIAEDGFDGMTMRRLANKFGFAAKTLYNYFSSKDEIYLMVLERGFEILNSKVENSGRGLTDPVIKLRSMCRTYVDFGIRNANYYNIMFNWDVPRYIDYKNTIIEPVAREEKDIAYNLAAIIGNAVDEIWNLYQNFSREDVSYLILRLWATLHGVVSLYNSGGIHSYESRPDAVVERLIEDAIRPFLP